MKVVQKSKKLTRKRGMYTDPIKQDRIRQKRVLGFSKREIARQEGVSFQTVAKITDDDQAKECQQKGRFRYLAGGLTAVDILIEYMLSHKNSPLALEIAREFVLNTGIVSRKESQTTGQIIPEVEIKSVEVLPPEKQKTNNYVAKMIRHYAEVAEATNQPFPKMLEEENPVEK